MATRVFNELAAMHEVISILGGNPDAVSYKGKKTTFRRGIRAAEIERELMFDDEGYNSYEIREVKP